MTHDEIIKIVSAHKEGREIEGKFKHNDDSCWIQPEHIDKCGFNFYDWDYRIKGEIQEGDLVLIVAKPDWDDYVFVMRVKGVYQDRVVGPAIGKGVNHGRSSFSFDKNNISKITI